MDAVGAVVFVGNNSGKSRTTVLIMANKDLGNNRDKTRDNSDGNKAIAAAGTEAGTSTDWPPTGGAGCAVATKRQSNSSSK